GAWLGYLAVREWVMPWLAPLAYAADWTMPEWLPSVAGIAVGVLVGWLLGRPLNVVLGSAFGMFNVAFDYSTGMYTRAVGVLLGLSAVVLVAYAGLLGLTYWSFTQTPTGF